MVDKSLIYDFIFKVAATTSSVELIDDFEPLDDVSKQYITFIYLKIKQQISLAQSLYIHIYIYIGIFVLARLAAIRKNSLIIDNTNSIKIEYVNQIMIQQ